MPGYREEPGVASDSATETYIAAKLYVDNWRWADTPFYVRAGKRLPRRETTIAIQFQRAPHPPFAEIAGEGLRPNVLLIHVQPDEGVSLAIGAKVPGAGMSIRTVHMDFLYGGAFRTSLPEAYERLILDAMLGDATLFTRSDEVDEQWGARRRDRGRLEARPAELPQLPGRKLGPAGGRRADRAATAAAGDGIEPEHRRPGREAPRRAARAPRRGDADERDDARRVGAAAVGRRRERGRWRGSRSCTRRGRSCSSRSPERPTRSASTSS